MSGERASHRSPHKGTCPLQVELRMSFNAGSALSSICQGERSNGHSSRLPLGGRATIIATTLHGGVLSCAFTVLRAPRLYEDSQRGEAQGLRSPRERRYRMRKPKAGHETGLRRGRVERVTCHPGTCSEVILTSSWFVYTTRRTLFDSPRD